MESLLEIKNLSKCYAKDLRKSIRYASSELFRSTFGLKTEHEELRDSEFWALRDINLNLHRGDVLAVLGHNGAGKSTLLKCIADKIKPTKGSISVNGQLGHMIEMSAGFDPLLTGRENVALRGRLMGKRGRELDGYIEKVREFAEIDDFFDSAVQIYSSGMKSRLGFAASSCIEPDILIIDEVLAVGDLGFRLKCYQRMNELSRKCAVIFVSHSLGQVARMCNRAIYLEKGRLLFDGAVQQGVALYQDKISDLSLKKKFTVLNSELVDLDLYVDDILYEGQKIDYGSCLVLKVDISKLTDNVSMRVLLRDASGSVVADWNSVRQSLDWPVQPCNLTVNLGEAQFGPGLYSLSLEVMSEDRVEHLCLSEPITFKMGGVYFNPLPVQLRAEWKFDSR